MNPSTGGVTACGKLSPGRGHPFGWDRDGTALPRRPVSTILRSPRHSRSRLGRHHGVRAIPRRICFQPGTGCPEDTAYSGHTPGSHSTGRGSRRPVGCPVVVCPLGRGSQRVHQGRLRDERDCSPNTGPEPRSTRRSPSPAQPTDGECRAGSHGKKPCGPPSCIPFPEECRRVDVCRATRSDASQESTLSHARAGWWAVRSVHETTLRGPRNASYGGPRG